VCYTWAAACAHHNVYNSLWYRWLVAVRKACCIALSLNLALARFLHIIDPAISNGSSEVPLTLERVVFSALFTHGNYISLRARVKRFGLN